jgi:flagellar hook-associated protein 2
MSSAGISFGGLASGLDTKAIISALVAIEERPIRALESKKTGYTKQKSLFGDLKGLLDKLTEAAKKLKTSPDFLQRKATSDDEDIVTASASSSASPGTYKVEVLSLAKAQVVASTGSAAASTAFGTPGAEMTLHIGGNDHVITIGGTPTLESIAAAINAAEDTADFGVRAEVVDTGNTAGGGANRYQLVLSSTQTGPEGAFSLTADSGAPEFFNLVDQLNNNTPVSTPSQATLKLNGGITVYRNSNQISDLIPGVTLNLLSDPNPSKDVTITVANDAEATKKQVQEFVDAYNKVVDFLGEQSALDAEGKAKSPLFGDPTLRSVRSALRSVVGGSVEGTGNPSFQMLSQLGITADKAGKLTFTASKLEEALAEDEDAVAAVFTHATNGIAGRLIDRIDGYTDAVDGLFKTRNDTFERQVKDTQARIEQAERRLTLYEQQLETKYANLESLLSRLQGQGSSVSAINSMSR